MLQPCNTKYEYETLISNYLKCVIDPTLTDPLITCTSTAKERMSFNGNYLYSYRTAVAKYVPTEDNGVLLVTTNKHSQTTAKHLGILRSMAINRIITVDTYDIDAGLSEVANDLFTRITNLTIRAADARGSTTTHTTQRNYLIAQLNNLLPVLHHSTRAMYKRKLSALPDIPSTMNKFTRTAYKAVLQHRNII